MYNACETTCGLADRVGRDARPLRLEDLAALGCREFTIGLSGVVRSAVPSRETGFSASPVKFRQEIIVNCGTGFS